MKILLTILVVFFATHSNVNAFYQNNHYPTLAIVEYVNTCIASNKNKFTALQPCVCSIDLIADKIPYDKYVELEALLRLQEIHSEKTLVYKAVRYNKKLDILHNAQIQANEKCFTSRKTKFN